MGNCDECPIAFRLNCDGLCKWDIFIEGLDCALTLVDIDNDEPILRT